MYILSCADGSPYVGSTSNLEYRVSQHQLGEGGLYTAARLPVKLVFSEEHPTIYEAFLREREVKGWSRAKKEALVGGDYARLPQLSRSKKPRAEPERPSTGSG